MHHLTEEDLPEASWKIFCEDRNRALRSLSHSKIHRFFKRWGMEPPPERFFWKWVHLTRVFNEDLVEDERRYSINWLYRVGHLPKEAVDALEQRSRGGRDVPRVDAGGCEAAP